MGCRRRAAVWEIPGEILLLLLARGKTAAAVSCLVCGHTLLGGGGKGGERNFGRERQGQSRPGQQGVREYRQEAVGAQSGREKDRGCVRPFGCTLRGGGRQKGMVCALVHSE